MSATTTASCSTENPLLASVFAEVKNYLRCADLTLLKSADDENFLIILLLLGISGGKVEDIRDPSFLFDQLYSQGNRQVCQYQFKRNDIVWICRDCQKDETCVLCNDCFQGSDHENHDVYFYHSQVGGCCDCGDVNAWAPEGFCCKHGKEQSDPLEHMPPDFKTVGTGILKVVAQEMSEFFESRRNCFDFDSFELLDCFDSSEGVDTEEEVEEECIKPPLNFLFSVTTAAALLDISHSSSSNMGLNSEDFSEQHNHSSSEYTSLMDCDAGDMICLHDDDINTSEKVITSLTSIGISMQEAVRVRRETAHSGSCTFLPNFDHSFLPKSIVSKKSRMSIKLTEKLLKNLTPGMKYYLILKTSAETLREQGLKVSIISKEMAAREARMKSTLSFLMDFSQINDGMCRMVSLCLSVDVLLRILTVFPYLPKSISEPLHNLMLSQMADKMFKKDLAIAYAEGYVLFTQAYGRGYGTVDFSIYSLSVQFLNRDFLVSEIVNYHDFFSNLCVAIDDMLDSACGIARVEGALIGCAEEKERSERMLRHPVLTHRRYNPMFADLKVVFAIPGMSRRFLASTMPILMRILDRFQYLHPQSRETLHHVTFESSEWITAFNLFLCIGNHFEWLNNWLDDPSATSHVPIAGHTHTEVIRSPERSYSEGDSQQGGDKEDRSHEIFMRNHLKMEFPKLYEPPVCAIADGEGEAAWRREVLPSMTSVLRTALRGVLDWQARYALHGPLPGHHPSMELNHRPLPLYLPPLPASFSFHLPLHRFFASVVSEGCKYASHTKALLDMQRTVVTMANHISISTSTSTSNSSKEPSPSSAPSTSSSMSHQLSALIDYPIRSALLGSQIRVGMWRKNGSGMTDQLLNYMDIPTCKVFRDLDVLLIQFCVRMYSAKRLVCHILERYGVLGYVSDGQGFQYASDSVSVSESMALDSANSPSDNTKFNGTDYSSPRPPPPAPVSSSPPGLDDAAFFPSLVEEALLLLINIATEIPPPPTMDPLVQSESAMRREIIHFLAGKNTNFSTFSQLQDHVGSCTLEFAKISPILLEQVINEVADKKKNSVLEPPFFVLKKEMWLHYDPANPHVTFKMHQNATEKRPKNTVPTPISPPLQPCHPIFSSVRADIVLDPFLLHTLRSLMYVAVATTTQHKTYSPVRGWDLKCGGVELNRVLHLLTIAMHVVTGLSRSSSSPPQHPISASSSSSSPRPIDSSNGMIAGEGEGEGDRAACPSSSSEGSSPSLSSRLIAFLLEEPVVLTGAESGGAGASSGTEPQTHRLPHLLCVLADLEEALEPVHEHVQKSAVSWIVRESGELDARCKSYLKSRILGNGASKEISMEEKRRKARERAMNAMKASASKFSAHLDEEKGKEKSAAKGKELQPVSEGSDTQVDVKGKVDVKTNGEDIKESNGNEDSTGGKAALTGSKSSDVDNTEDDLRENALCIVCQAQGEQRTHGRHGKLPDIGLLAFSQLSHHGPAAREDSRVGAGTGMRLVPDIEVSEKEEDGEEGDVHLSYCGHAMHFSCFDSYYASVLSRSESQMEMMLDTDRGQFDCPLCKRLSNLLVPITRVHSPPSDSSTDLHVTAVCGEMCSRSLSETGTGAGRVGDEEPRKRKTLGASSTFLEADKASRKTQRPESSRGERGSWSESGSSTSASTDWFTADDGPMSVVDCKCSGETAAPRAVGSSSSGSGGEALPSWVVWMNKPVLVQRVPVRVKVPEKKEVKGFHRHRRRLTTVNARHREEETEREYFETFRGNEDGAEGDEDDSQCPVLTEEPFHSHEEPSDSRDDEGYVTMIYGDEEGEVEGEGAGEGEGEGEPPADIDVTAEGAGEEGDDVWYDVYDLRALGIQRDGESGDRGEGEGEGEAVGFSHEASAGASDDIPPEMTDEEADGQQSWRWDGYEESSPRDNYGADDRAEEFRDSDEDDDDSMNDNDMGSGGGGAGAGGESLRGRARGSFGASVSDTGDTALARRTRVLSAYFSRLAKLSDQHPHRENIKFWARFLIGLCLPKLGPADSLDWVKDFESKRRIIRRKACPIFGEQNAGDPWIVEKVLGFLFFGPAQVQCIETVLSGLAFSFSIDEVESSPLGPGASFPRVKLLETAVSGVGSSIRCFKGYTHVQESLTYGMAGMKKGVEDVVSADWGAEGSSAVAAIVNESDWRTVEHEDAERKKGEAGGQGERSSEVWSGWLDDQRLPLLARPHLDCVVLLLALVHPTVMEEEEEFAEETVEDIEGQGQGQGQGRKTSHSFEGAPAMRSQLHRDIVWDDDFIEEAGREKEKVKEKVKEKATLRSQDRRFYYREIPGAAAAAIRWVCLAHLLQLMISGHLAPGSGPRSTDGLKEEQAVEPLADRNVIVDEWSVGRLLLLLQSVTRSHMPHLQSTTGPLRYTEEFLKKVLEKWQSFLRVVAHTLSICRPDLLTALCPSRLKATTQAECSADGSQEEHPLPSPCLTDDTVTAAMRSVGLQAVLKEQEGAELWGEVEAAAVRWVCALDSPQLLLNMPGTRTSTSTSTSDPAATAPSTPLPPCATAIYSPPSRSQEAGQGESNRSAEITATVGTGHNTQKRFSHLKSALTRRFPFPARPALFPLPSSYTQLHSQLTAMGGYAFPALCLLCGAVLDANGRGKCATHAMICSKDAGVIFLLQDCTVLLSIGPRCSYFPTPYVDDYGEKHKHCRGKPLHLDAKRLEILRKLWVTHGVGNEVYQKRSTSNRVVINGHY